MSPDDDRQKAVADLNDAVAGKVVKVKYSLKEVTSDEAMKMVGERVNMYTDAGYRSVTVQRVDYPYAVGTRIQRRHAHVESVRVDLREARRIQLTNRAIELVVLPKSVAWLDVEKGVRRQVSLTQVETITDFDHGRGALEGIGMALFIGVSFGALAGYTGSSEGDLGGRGGGAAIGAIGFGIIGIFLGLTFGASRGHRYIYQLEHVRDNESD